MGGRKAGVGNSDSGRKGGWTEGDGVVTCVCACGGEGVDAKWPDGGDGFMSSARSWI